MPSIPRSLLAVSLAALALPGAAAAATCTVAAGGRIQTSVDDTSCTVIDVSPGTYSESISTSRSGITIKGEPGAAVVSPSTATGSTPTIAFTATSGAANVVSGLTLVNATTTGPVIAGGTNGLTVADSLVVSTTGDGVDFGGGTNLVQRAQLVTVKAGAAAAAIASASGDAAKTLALDSTVLSGPVALSATYATPTALGAGITVSARHVTAIGDTVADSSGAPSLGAQPIALTYADSIVRGKRTQTTGTGTVGATITPDARSSVADTPADAAALFVNAAKLNYHLRADAPVIGKGQLSSGESATDIDGDPRSVGGVSDLGADQFVNKPPTAVLAPVTGTQRQNQPITFNASQSADPEATSGGGIATYHWNFGDGQTATTTTPTATHAYSAKQTYNVTVSVTDKQGASATSAPVSFTVLDGVAPTVVVATPASHQRLALYRSRKVHGRTVRTKRRLGVTFLGGAQDDVALGRVLLALRPAATKGGTCRWFNGRSALRTGPCTAPLLLSPTLINGGWRYSLPIKAKLPVGAYDLYAVAVDASGLSSATKIVAFRFR